MTNQLKPALLATLGAMTLFMISCAKTSNSGTSSTPAAASVCTTAADGTSRDQYGRACSNYAVNNGSCVNTRYNPQTGQYLSLTTGQVVNCTSTGYTDGINSLPANGLINGQMISGCAGWSNLPQFNYAQYVPVDAGNGQLVCMNTAYLQQYNPGYNWSQYAYQQTPIYTCSGWDCDGGYDPGYGYGGGGSYGCSTSINFGVSFGGLFGIGGGLCAPGL